METHFISQFAGMTTTQICLKSTVAVLSQVPKLTACLSEVLPAVDFREVNLGKDAIDFNQPDVGLSSESLKLLQQSEIIIADYNLITPYLYDLQHTRWIQGTWAGADTIFKAYNPTKPPIPYTITRFSGDFFGSQMAEYVVAMVVNRERLLHRFKNAQASHLWDKDETFPLRRNIQDLTFTILGLGNIGICVASVLKSLGARVWGVGRTEKNPPPSSVDQYRTQAGLQEALSAADYVVSVLPSTAATAGLLGGGVLEVCARRRAVLVNIGRGSVLPEDELLEALERGWLGGAVLDVFTREPLPADNPLWSHPLVDITPHVSGITRPKDVAAFFCTNLQRYISGKPLLMILDLKRGY